jgi:hypothetical protein
MTDWRTTMRNAVERDEEDCLSREQAESMRQVVLAAVADPASDRAQGWWMRRPVLAAATVVAMLSIGVGAGLHLDFSNRSEQMAASEPAPSSRGADSLPASTPNRQLQFLTPGGTRIIWVFNQDLDLKATLR